MEEPNPSEESMDTDTDEEAEDEEEGGGVEDEGVVESTSLPALPLPPLRGSGLLFRLFLEPLFSHRRPIYLVRHRKARSGEVSITLAPFWRKWKWSRWHVNPPRKVPLRRGAPATGFGCTSSALNVNSLREGNIHTVWVNCFYKTMCLHRTLIMLKTIHLKTSIRKVL